MLCHTIDGYASAVEGADGVEDALLSTDVASVFETLFFAPLAKVQPPEGRKVILIDALDEIPKERQHPLLSVIAKQLSSLPDWLSIFVTSREERNIKEALRGFSPRELRADEENNQADVEA